MSFRYMRMIVFFDLPTVTAKERRDYNKFRKGLIKEGFIMMQESVYVKLALNNSIVNSEREKIKKIKPKNGIIQLLIITEKQFSGIEYLLGGSNNSTLDNTERLIVL